MSMTKRYLESLPKEQQDAILGVHPDEWDDGAEYCPRCARHSLESLGLKPLGLQWTGAADEADREWAEALATEAGGSELC